MHSNRKIKMENEEKHKDEKCRDRLCPSHGSLSVRGRTFKGEVKKIIGRRAVIEFERLAYLKKYQRYAKRLTRLHAHIPECLMAKVTLGSRIKIGECRPISKIVHFVVTEVEK